MTWIRRFRAGAIPSRTEVEALPPLVREIQEETEHLIRTFDRAFLHTCGVAWESDIVEHERHDDERQSWFRRLVGRRHSLPKAI
ncbi:MAG TPA: hypothetical protein VKU01_27325 [Bryobacteraceae bacterium]|nr:hypothetical protein [Bryobacteraceae bacterium]